MRVGLIQLSTGNEIDPETEKALAFICEAACGGAKFVTTPETTHLMQMGRDAVLSKACYQDDDQGLKAFCALAADLNIWLHIGSLITKVAEDKLANRAYMINPKGAIVATYDKNHLFDVTLPNGETYCESALYQAGDEAVVVETPLASFGLSICYDLRFPYLYRDMALKGAQVLLVPAAFTVKTGEAHWHTLLKARAIETGCYVLAAAQTGRHATGRSTYGHSLAISPWGEVLADAGVETGVTFVDLDLVKVQEVRQTVPALAHSRAVKTKVVQAT